MPPPAPQRVLIVRPSALGDVARTVPAAVAIKRQWPGCRLAWVVNRPFAAAVENHRAVDEVIPFDRDEPRKVLRLMWGLRRRRFDVVYDLQGLARSGLLTWATRAKRRVGFADAREGGWLGCNVRHRVGPGDAPRMGQVWALRKMLGLLAADGVAVPDAPAAVAEDLALGLDPQAAAWAEALDLPAGGFLVVAPTAQWGCKCWPAESFAESAAALIHAGNGLVPHVVVVGTVSEKPRVEAVMRGLRDRGIETSWRPTSVARLMALLSRARLVLANDSAPLHLAAGLGVPTVSVFGPTDPALVGPWGYATWGDDPPPAGVGHLVVRAKHAVDGATDYRQRRDDDGLIAGVPAEDVTAAAAYLLRETVAARSRCL